MKLLRVIREFVEAPKAEKVTYHKQRAALGTMSVFASVASTIQPDREVSSFRAEGTEVLPTPSFQCGLANFSDGSFN